MAKLTGDESGHLTKTVVTGVTEHEGPSYYHHAHSVYDGSYEDGTASCRRSVHFLLISAVETGRKNWMPESCGL